MELNVFPESFDLTNQQNFRDYLNVQLTKYNVNGISGSFILPSRMSTDHLNAADTDNHLKELFHILPFVAGKSDVAKNIDMEPSTWVQFASISKTVGTAYAMQVFQKHNITVASSVNSILDKYGSTFKLVSIDETSMWGDEVTFEMLLSHTAGLKMHYVNGISLKEEFPPVLDLLTGKYQDSHGYPSVRVQERPGEHFSYSGASFLVLQHVLEIVEAKNIAESLQIFTNDAEGNFPYNKKGIYFMGNKQIMHINGAN